MALLPLYKDRDARVVIVLHRHAVHRSMLSVGLVLLVACPSGRSGPLSCRLRRLSKVISFGLASFSQRNAHLGSLIGLDPGRRLAVAIRLIGSALFVLRALLGRRLVAVRLAFLLLGRERLGRLLLRIHL